MQKFYFSIFYLPVVCQMRAHLLFLEAFLRYLLLDMGFSPVSVCNNEYKRAYQLNWASETSGNLSLLNRNVLLQVYVKKIKVFRVFNIGNQLSQVQNYILLETKFYIFYTKHLETPLSITHLKNKLKRTFKILESLAIKNNNIENFKIEWNPYSNILSQ